MFHKAKTSTRWVQPRTLSLRKLRRKSILTAIWSTALLAPMQLNGAIWTGGSRTTEQASDSVLLVLAAASLADVLPRIGDEWERLGGTPLVFSFDATSRLAVQASQSGAGDIFFSADPQWIRWLEEQGTVSLGSAVHFAANELVIAVSQDVSVPAEPDMLLGFERIALAGEMYPQGNTLEPHWNKQGSGQGSKSTWLEEGQYEGLWSGLHEVRSQPESCTGRMRKRSRR